MTNQITVYSYHPETFEYVGKTIARRDPLEQEEIFLIPAHATEKQPIFEEGKLTKFIDNEWILEDIPLPPEPPKPTLQEAKTFKISQLTQNRSLWQYQNIIIGGRTFKNSPTAQNKLVNLVATTKDADYPIKWIYEEGIFEISKVQAYNLIDTIKTREYEAYIKEYDLTTQINACTTIEEVEAININF